MVFGGLSAASHATANTMAGSITYFGLCGGLAVLVLSAFRLVLDDTGKFSSLLEGLTGLRANPQSGEPSDSSSRGSRVPPRPQKSRLH
jgi:hypothetical protein